MAKKKTGRKAPAATSTRGWSIENHEDYFYRKISTFEGEVAKHQGHQEKEKVPSGMDYGRVMPRAEKIEALRKLAKALSRAKKLFSPLDRTKPLFPEKKEGESE
jgi:hypothetical protein